MEMIYRRVYEVETLQNETFIKNVSTIHESQQGLLYVAFSQTLSKSLGNFKANPSEHSCSFIKAYIEMKYCSINFHKTGRQRLPASSTA